MAWVVFHAGDPNTESGMDTNGFIKQADDQLALLEEALTALQDSSTADWDFELKPGGVIEIDFGEGGKIVINRHAAAREIWVAARSGGFHFAPPQAEGNWLDTRSGDSLPVVLARCMSEQAGESMPVAW